MCLKQVVYILIFSSLITTSCKKHKVVIGAKKVASIGAKNHLALVVDNNLWDSDVGDSIRKYIARRVSGTLKYESAFDITQLNQQLFTSEEKKNRNLITFERDSLNSFTLKRSYYSTPQNYFSIKYSSNEDLIQQVRQYSDSIVSVFHDSEINEEQHYINRNYKQNASVLKSKFGINIVIPGYYNIKQNTEEPFLWFQKQLPSGDVNLVFYETPADEFINKNEVGEIFEIHNNIGEKYIRNFANTGYYKVDSTFIPEVKLFDFSGIDTYEIKGAYQMKNDIFYGPYIIYVFKDVYYNRYLFVQGFINNLNKPKRDELMELEAITKSISFFEN